MVVDRGQVRFLNDNHKINIPALAEPPEGDSLLVNVQRLCQSVEGLTARLGDTLPQAPVRAVAAVVRSAQAKALEAAKLGLNVRRQRDKFLGDGLFSEPAWDILLELFVARCEKIDVTVGNACLAASVSMTSALRCCQALLDRDIVYRERDPRDGRRVFLRISEEAFGKLTTLLAQTRTA